MESLKLVYFSTRIFEIGERWADERTLALCMSDGGYINEYVMNAYIKMILNDQSMKDHCGERIACLKHIIYTELTVSSTFTILLSDCQQNTLIALFELAVILFPT